MPEQLQAINIADVPALRELVAEVTRTRKRRSPSVDGEDVTLILEPSKPRRSPSRARPVTRDDALYHLVGIGKSDTPSNAAEHKHEALAEAYRKLHTS